jgi:hypothetical protein
MRTVTFSRRFAVLTGIVLALGETLRRWHQLSQPRMWPAWLDDVVLGGLLIYGAWRTGKDVASGRPFLAAAWGTMVGAAFVGLGAQISFPREADPSGLSQDWVVAVRTAGLVLAAVGLVTAVWPARVDGGPAATRRARH